MLTRHWSKALLLLTLFLASAAAIAVPAPEEPSLTSPPPLEAPQLEAEETSQTTPPAPPVQPPQQPVLPPPSQPQRKAEVVVVDVTRNTSSVVSITIESEPLEAAAVPTNGELGNANLTQAQKQQLKLASQFRCLTERQVNIFMLVHLNRNWRQKLTFIQHLMAFTYRQGATNVVIVFFNAFNNILATFGTDPVGGEAGLFEALAHVWESMERDESAGVVEHWTHFQLADALKTCYRYARLFLHQFSLDARPSVLVSYFDDSAAISEATMQEAERALEQIKLAASSAGTFGSPFAASVSILQWPASLPVPPQWARISEMLSSSPGLQVTADTEDSLLSRMADLAGGICNRTVTKAAPSMV